MSAESSKAAEQIVTNLKSADSFFRTKRGEELLRDALEMYAAEVREQCAQIAEAQYGKSEWHSYFKLAGRNIGAAIRAMKGE